MHKKIFYLAGILLGLIFSFQISLAQETESAEAVLIADVNIYEAKIVSQDKNNFKLSFDLSNGELVQPDLKYAIQLIKEDEDGKQTIMDERIYPEVVNLNKHQNIKKEIIYDAPTYLNGEFQIWIIAKNQNGLTLSVATLGKVNLMGENQYVEILVDSCYLQVEGANNRYTIGQGVDIENEENLVAICDVVNHYKNNINAVPQIETFWRTSFGMKIETEQQDQIKLDLKSKDKKRISLVLPKPKVSQAYDAQLQLKDDQNRIISNKVTFHYVLRGLSATIQNLRLDKNYYQRDEIARISFFWSGPADNFMESRVGGTDSGKLSIQLFIKDKDNQDCIDKFTKELEPKNLTPDFTIPVIRECFSPQVVVSILDEKGSVLDEKGYALESESLPVKTTDKKDSIKSFVTIFIVTLFVISLMLIFFSSKRKKGSKLVIFILMASGILGMNIVGARAASFNFNYGVRPQYSTGSYVEHNMSITPSLNKTVYDPGESMTGSMNVSNIGCQNSWFDYSLRITLRSGATRSVTFGSVINNETKSTSYTDTAPMTPGNYVATFSFLDNRCFSGGACASVLSSPSASPFATPDGVYLINKASKIGWPVWDTYQAFLAAGLTPYQHYQMFGKTPGCTQINPCEDISPCKASCDSRASQVFVSVPYTVSSPPPPPPPPSNCNLPWGGTISSGSSVPAYQVASVPSGNTCPPPENRVCNNGILSGSFINQSCVVDPPPPAPTVITVDLVALPPSPLNIPVTINNGTVVFGTSQTTLSWTIQNANTICPTLGCSCVLSMPDGSATSSIPYSLTNSNLNKYIATLGKGSHSFTITCSKN